jgi:hypothetical protein
MSPQEHKRLWRLQRATRDYEEHVRYRTCCLMSVSGIMSAIATCWFGILDIVLANLVVIAGSLTIDHCRMKKAMKENWDD